LIQHYSRVKQTFPGSLEIPFIAFSFSPICATRRSEPACAGALFAGHLNEDGLGAMYILPAPMNKGLNQENERNTE